uniref:DNA damage-binding protein 1 n=1 Tax=Plectus sambesii TaxID=2011161 RepID=A0A914W0R3_9BILA
MNGKLLAAINSSVRLFEWTPEKELRLECSHFNFITALYLKTKGDFVLAGDIMRSVCLLAYKSVESTFEEIARDYNPNWMTSVEIIDEDTFLGAENSFNMYTVQKDSAATTDEDRMRLQGVGAYHLGEMVNVFRRGSLVMNHVTGESGPPVHTPILYGSVEGGLGLIAQLPEDYYKFVHDLEARIAKSTTNALRVEHTVYRSFTTEKRTEPVNGFVDGDLVETLLDLPRDLVGQIVQGIHLPVGAVENTSSREGGTVDQVIKLVEDLARIH